MARREWNVARNGQFRRLAKSAGVRRNLHQYAGTGAIRQEKTPTENGWGFIIGGGGGNRTRVRRHSMPGTTCLARCSISDDGNTTCEAHRRPHPLDFGAGWRVAAGTYPVIMTLHPRAQAQVGSGLRLKRRERSCRRWQLEFCRWIYEESCPLGMHQETLQPPSKPVHPRESETS